MNKRGVTILELLISIVIISVVVLLLLQVIMSLRKINNDETYASGDEINRTTIIKNIEHDFLTLGLKGLNVKKEDNKTIINLIYEEESKELIIKDNELIYEDEYSLKSNKASYDICPDISYVDLDDYYLIKINIKVLIDNKNTTLNDDIELTYLGLKKEDNNYQINKVC